MTGRRFISGGREIEGSETGRRSTSSQSEEFWNWFRDVAVLLAGNIENQGVLQELDRRVHGMDPRLSWEIGPGGIEPWQLVISPNLDRDLRATAREIISLAPVLHGWEFHSARRPKAWDYKLLMNRSGERPPLELDVSGWNFVVLRYPDSALEIMLEGEDLSVIDDDERWQMAALVLESILGEELLLDKITEFELVDQIDPRFADQSKSIQQLKETVLAV